MFKMCLTLTIIPWCRLVGVCMWQCVGVGVFVGSFHSCVCMFYQTEKPNERQFEQLTE